MDEIPKPNYTIPEIPDEVKHLPDRIAESLIDKTFFITGGSGFLGKVLIEKILRRSPNVKKIYLLMRPKHGKDSKQRIEELFQSAVFSLLKKTHGPKILDKIQVIAGDCSQLHLGISEEDRAMLAKEVDIIYHCAATIRFDEPLRKAVLLNTRGTHYMVEMAKTFTKLQLFCYISTAYCHLDEKILEEKAYPSPVDPHKIIKSCELMDEELVEKVAEKLLRGFPNSYAFTKNLSETIVYEAMQKGLPCIIVRPSVVIPTWLEPLPGFMDNINGPTGLLIGAGKGVIRTMYCDNNGYADFIPVDICVNGIMLATWNYVGLNDKTRVIHNLTSSSEWKVTWQEIIDLGKDIVTKDIPLNNAVWYPGGSMKRNKLIHQICVILFHMIPAYFLDAIIFLSGNKPVLLRVQDRINKGFEVFEYYANNQWMFKNEHLLYMRPVLNPREKILYKIDGDGMDIKKYFMDCILSARLHILKETPDTIPHARRHMRMLYWVDLFARIAFYAFMLWFFVSCSGTMRNFAMSVYKVIHQLIILLFSIPYTALFSATDTLKDTL